jgi:choline-sulfatase
MLGVEFSDDEIRTAIRAYYGSISYIDHLVSRVLEALKNTGADQNTVIIFTSDHGEMLGERGMWFKKHFFEKSMHIPLIMNAPWITPERVEELVSLVDLLPTFNAIAGIDGAIEPLEGVDLLSLTGQTVGERTRKIYAEYLAETTPVPIFMIRAGDYKYIASSVDGELMFNVADDPDEQTNLASDPTQEDRLHMFRDECAKKWDEAALTQDIKQSQKRRILVRAAMGEGEKQRWNHNETSKDQVIWYRGEQRYNEWAFKHI